MSNWLFQSFILDTSNILLLSVNVFAKYVLAAAGGFKIRNVQESFWVQTNANTSLKNFANRTCLLCSETQYFVKSQKLVGKFDDVHTVIA
jgi:hypothetical protein